MLVKIIKAKTKQLWYANAIGETFEVVESKLQIAKEDGFYDNENEWYEVEQTTSNLEKIVKYADCDIYSGFAIRVEDCVVVGIH